MLGATLGLCLAACATMPRLYSDQELLDAGRMCGVAPGSLLQAEEEPRLLIFFASGVPAAQQICVKRWSRKRHLTLALAEIEEKSQ